MEIFAGLGLATFSVVLWLSFIALPWVPRQLNPDFGWMIAFAHFHREGFQAGVDYVFTYGPLSFLVSSLYERDLLGVKLLWEAVFKLVVVVLALRQLRRQSGFVAQGLCALALLWILVNQSYPDSGYLAGTFLLGAFLIERAPAPPWMAAGLALLAVLGLIKFTLLSYGAVIAVAVALAAVAAAGLAWGIGILAFFGAALAVAWMAAGQALANLPLYLQRSFMMASGYEEAAAYEGRPVEVALGLPLLLLGLVWIGRALAGAGRAVPRLLTAGLAALTLALSWRHGYVGSGGFHFFAFAGLLPFFLVLPAVPSSRERQLRILGLALAVVLATVGLAVANHEERTPGRVLGAWAMQAGRVAPLARDPLAWREARERELATLRALYDLPRIRERVGRETIDVFYFEQGAVLLNGLRWKPRPVQSHLTYTPELARLNAAFFEGDAAPRFVLYQHQVLHGRLPLLDDSAALQVLFRRYEPVLAEGFYLLLERRKDAPAEGSPERVLERQVDLGAWIDTSAWEGEPLLVRLEVDYTRRGWLRRLWLRAPPLFLEVQADRGRPQRRELVRSTAAQPFVLSPWLPSHAALAAWRSGQSVRSVSSFRVVARDAHLVRPAVGVTLLRDSRLAPAQREALVRYPMFDPQPVEVSSAGPRGFAQVAEGVALVLAPPAEVRFHLPPGRYRLDALYGRIPRRGPTRTLTYTVEHHPAGRAAVRLVERTLEARPEVAVQRSRRLRPRFESDEESELVLRTEADGAAGGLPYWADVRITAED
jgi:hypothetical protein